MPTMLKFDLPKNPSNIIKVIGVGGGGSNAVTHMFHQGIKGVDFIICNTDAQAMDSSPVPVKIQLGTNLTAGLGAGAVPSIGRNAALENAEEIREILQKETKMLFVTAGLGGGTGTGAAPVIAEISKELGILTVGIVTIPFAFEGRKRKLHADEGIKQLKEHVDALLIISNDKLRELYGNLRLSEAFGQADNVLTTAARGIAEIITVTGYINVDFEDVKTVMKDSGVAIMGTGIASGEHRAQKAVEQAISSPLLNNNDIEGANNLLLYIASGSEEIMMDEVTEITDYIQTKTKSSTEVIWGNGFDERLENGISVTIIATGFDDDHRQKGDPGKKNVVIRELYESENEPPRVETRVEEPELLPAPMPEPVVEAEPEVVMEETEIYQREIFFDLDPPKPEPATEPEQEVSQEMFLFAKEVETISSGVQKQPAVPGVEPDRGSNGKQPGLNRMGNDRIEKLKALSEKLKNHTPIENNLYELESVPAYKRRNVELADVAPSSESDIPRMSLSDEPEKGLEIRSENSFLHKNVD
ncbi:MAG: cell division protein FtsZ [bacterium]